MSVTIKDIAKIAGVSHSTVSRSLNDSPLISEKTKTRIKKIAEELRFEYNANARGLSTKRTGSVGIVYPEIFEQFNINLFFSELLNNIRYVLERESLDIIVAFPKNRHTGESNIRKLINKKKIDGLIIVHSYPEDEDMKFIIESQIPYVFLHKTPPNKEPCEGDYFFTDHFAGGYLATIHLLKCGYKSITTITVPSEEFLMRTDGYKAALAKFNISFSESWIMWGDCTFESGYRNIIENVELIKKSGAVFVQSDLMAMGAIEALRKLSLKVPKDVAVVGYDDIELGIYISPKLTTVHQPREKIASLACERLIKLLNRREKGGDRIIKQIKPRLIVRESCGGCNLT